MIPMQFTGLHDKNREAIYEGDILSLEWGLPERHKSLHSIVFSDGRFSGLDDMNDLNCTVGNFRCEVVGNIYENPYLI